MGIATKKMQGLRDEESALVRLADAIAGLGKLLEIEMSVDRSRERSSQPIRRHRLKLVCLSLPQPFVRGSVDFGGAVSRWHWDTCFSVSATRRKAGGSLADKRPIGCDQVTQICDPPVCASSPGSPRP
jgi:hypothetical protein